MERTYDALLEENNELRKALGSTKEVVERFRSDNESMKRMHEEFKLHHERLKKECQEAQSKSIEAIKSRKETENYYESYVAKLKSSVEQAKKDFEEIQTKMIPPMDTELLRVKLVNEIEGPMKIALDNKEDEIMRLQSQIYDLTKKLDLSTFQFSNYKRDTEIEIRDLKERYNIETTHLFSEIQHLQEKLEDTADKEIIRTLKRDKDELKLRLERAYEELDDIKKKSEVLKSEKNDWKAKYNKDIEEVTNKTRLSAIEINKLDLQNKDFIDQIHKLKLLYESKDQEINNLKKDVESYCTNLESSELQLIHCREEISELQRKLFEKDTQNENKIREVVKSEREKYAKDKDDRDKLQKNFDEIERQNRELSSSLLSQEREYKHELERKKQENSNLKEDLRLQESKNSAILRELDMYRSSISTKNEELERLQNDLKSLTMKLIESNKNLEISGVKIKQLEGKFEGDGKALNQTSGALEEKIKAAEANASFFKAKVREYKAKVKQGNEKIQELGLKLAKSEIERQKLLGIKLGPMEKDARFELKGNY
jgi:chromosome segregation ATPase